jgi:MFS family permease
MLGISWALIVYQMAGIGLGVICGRLGDIHGHHRTYGIGMAMMALGSLLCGFSQNVVQLVLFRFVQGVGGAMIQSSGRTLAFKAMPTGSEGKAQGLMAMSHQLGFFLGPPIGGLIIDWMHWRGIFFLLFVPGLVGVALCFINGRGAPAPLTGSREIDYRGAVLFIVLTVIATLLFDQKVAQAVGTGQEILLGAVFLAVFWIFLKHERRVASPMINIGIFSMPIFAYGSVGLLLSNINQSLTTFITPFDLQDVLMLSPSFIGVLFLVPSVFSMVLSPVSGALTDRIGSRVLLILGVLILMVSFVVGGILRINSHWILSAVLLGLSGIDRPTQHPGGDDPRAAQGAVGHGHRHHQRHLRLGPHARHLAQRHSPDLGVSLLHGHCRGDAGPGKSRNIRRVDEPDLLDGVSHRVCAVVYIDEVRAPRIGGAASIKLP